MVERIYECSVTTTSNTLKKAQLINEGQIFIPPSLSSSLVFNKSHAGPNSFIPCLTFQWNDHRVKLEITKDPEAVFSLQQERNAYTILKEQTEFLREITILPNPFHAPGQIFLTLEDRCIYHCAFCDLSTEGILHHHYSTEDFLHLIEKAIKDHNIKNVALTSGIYPTNKKIIEEMCFIITHIKNNYPTISFGVEPSIFSVEEIQALKQAGADEIKINIQIPDKRLFERICPDFSYPAVLQALQDAVALFGKGNVTSNIIYGLGETDASVIEMMNHLSSIGVVPTLRKIRLNNINKKELEQRLQHQIKPISSERIVQLARQQKTILQKYDLTPQTFQTMCHACGCCDLVPFCDI